MNVRTFLGIVGVVGVAGAAGCGGERAPLGESAPAPEPAAATSSPHGPSAPVADPLWSCTASPVQSSPGSRSAKVGLALVDPGGASPIAGATVRACGSAVDAACSEVVGAAETTTEGRASFDVPTGARGFAGYFETTRAGDLPNVAFVSPPIAADAPDYARPYWSRSDLGAFARMASIELEPEQGHVLVSTFDCRALGGAQAVPAAGVIVELDPAPPGARASYTVRDGAGVSLSASARSSDATGHAALFNVAAGKYTLVGRLASTGAVVARAPLHVRAGALSTIALVPGL